MSLDSGESELIVRAVAGDDHALGQLLVSLHNRLVNDIRLRLPADLVGTISGEDIAQEAYVVVFRRIRDFDRDAGATFYSWVAGIALNQLRDAVKAQRTEKRGGGRVRVVDKGEEDASAIVNLLELFAAHSRTPSRSAADHEAMTAVGKALEGLPSEYREVLQLRYMQAMPVAEVAERLQRTEGAIHQLHRRALLALGEALGDSAQFFSKKT